MRNKIALTVWTLLVLLVEISSGQVKLSTGNGNWNSAATWSPAGVPGPADAVTVQSGHSVTLDLSASCSSLTIGSGAGAAQLLFSGNAPVTVTIAGDLLIAAGSSFLILSNSNTTHSLIVDGNIINHGNLRFFQDINSLCDVLFTGNGNRSVSGTGLITRFNNIALNMGSSLGNCLDITTPTFSAATNFLTLYNGTFKFSSPGTTSIEPFRNLTSIPSTAGLWINSAGAIANTNAGINIGGLLRISAGSLAAGNGINEDLTSAGGTVCVTGGTLVVAGKYNAATAAGSFSMSGGQLVLAHYGSSSTSLAPFQMSAAGSELSISGGTVVIEREGGSGAQDLGYACGAAISVSVSGGVLQLGNANSPASQTISINSAQMLPGLLVGSNAVTAKVINSSIGVAGDVRLTSGTLTAGNYNITLSGNWDNGGVFVPGTGSVTLASGTAQYLQAAAGETFHHLTLDGTGVKTFSSGIQINGSFSIAPTATADAGLLSQTLTLKGDFSNDGNFIARNGTVLLNGSNAQYIGGASTTGFYNLMVDNPIGVTLNSSENIAGSLTLSNGTLNVNAQQLTLVSDASSTGRIAEIGAGGDIDGEVTVQRFIAGGATGWVLLGSPIASPLTLADWDDDIYISCPACPDGSAAGFLSIYRYDETQPGTHDAASAYLPLSGVTDPILLGRGYWVYLGTGAGSTADITMDMTGTVRKFGYSIPLDYTNYGSASDDGWNLVHNPYPSAISWSALKGAASGIDNAIYVYNPDLNAGSGGYASYVNGISSPALNAGGIGDNIPMCQGFYVHSTGATALSAQESNKVDNGSGFVKPSHQQPPLLRLALSGSAGVLDETVLYLQPGAGAGFDSEWDAYKLPSTDPAAAQLAICNGQVAFQINALPPLQGDVVVPLGITAGTSGSYSIGASELQGFPFGACLRLYDKATGSLTDLRSTGYSFFFVDTTLAPRFELRLSLHTLDIDSAVAQTGCVAGALGSIRVKGRNAGPWNYIWSRDGQEIRRSVDLAGPDSLVALSPGVYHLLMSSSGQCDQNSSYYTIYPQATVEAAFSTADTLWLDPMAVLQCSNTSAGAVHYLWQSGAGDSSELASPAFTYTAPGLFRLQLFCRSATGCMDSASRYVVVVDSLAHKSAATGASGLLLKRLDDSRYRLELSTGEAGTLQAVLLDDTGRVLAVSRSAHLSAPVLELDLGALARGVYLVRVFVNGLPGAVLRLPVQ